ncbi:Putative accessory gland protein [Gryllus bimaculatus]|nr:Putative accessory gland protein [Gryllus bimaculatus]
MRKKKKKRRTKKSYKKKNKRRMRKKTKDEEEELMAAPGPPTGINEKTPIDCDGGEFAPGTVMDLLCNFIQSLQKPPSGSEDAGDKNNQTDDEEEYVGTSSNAAPSGDEENPEVDHEDQADAEPDVDKTLLTKVLYNVLAQELQRKTTGGRNRFSKNSGYRGDFKGGRWNNRYSGTYKRI